MKSYTIAAFGILAISGCIESQAKDAVDRVAQCNAGATYQVTGSMAATINKNLSAGLKADAGVEQELKELFTSNAPVADADKLYKQYLICLNK